MEIKTETRLLLKETMTGMQVGEKFEISALRENSVKPTASRLKKMGYDFDITRKGDIMEVTCTKRPENKEGER